MRLVRAALALASLIQHEFAKREDLSPYRLSEVLTRSRVPNADEAAALDRLLRRTRWPGGAPALEAGQKLTRRQARVIRAALALDGLTQKEFARVFGVNKHHVGHVLNRKKAPDEADIQAFTALLRRVEWPSSAPLSSAA